MNYSYRKSRVCGRCWMSPERRRYRMLHVDGRMGRCDFCGERREVWVTTEPSRRTFLQELWRSIWPWVMFSLTRRWSYLDCRRWDDCEWLLDDEADAADERYASLRRFRRRRQ